MYMFLFVSKYETALLMKAFNSTFYDHYVETFLGLCQTSLIELRDSSSWLVLQSISHCTKNEVFY